MSIESKNAYMEEVLNQQAVVADELRAKRKVPHQQIAMAPRRMAMHAEPVAAERGPAVDVHVTGFWRWRTVIVPPNAWVVHTRRGHDAPLHVGVGVSFPYNPYTDAFLVAPATMQTLAINARCICMERQGIMVQAYVQWIVEDFKAAYKRLDFSDSDDPMRVVNVQLREQAEASIKDKVATMSIDDVLADKRPIIDELTSRLRAVAEGQGLKILQVQIKEAIISSTHLWENLQKSFREEQARIARIAELDRERAVREREVNDEIEAERARLLAHAQTERLRRQHEVELLKNNAELEDTRVKAELATMRAQRELEEARHAFNIDALSKELVLSQQRTDAQLKTERAHLEVEAVRRKVHNDVTPGRLNEMIVTALPALVQSLPQPHRVDVVNIGGASNGSNDGILAIAGLVKAVNSALRPDDKA